MVDMLKVDTPPAVTYRMLMELLSKKLEKRKLKHCVEPSYLEFNAPWTGVTPHVIKVEISGRNGESLVKFYFDFVKLYTEIMVLVLISFLVVPLMFVWKLIPENFFLSLMEGTMLASVLGCVISPSITKRKTMEEVTRLFYGSESSSVFRRQ